MPSTLKLRLPDGHPPPPPPPSALPSPGNIKINITFGEKLGRGRSGIVYTVEVSPNVGLPPLVAKIARIGCQGDLIREAAVYERLECIQGVAVPLCYGAFEGRLADGHTLNINESLMGYREDYEEAAYIETLPSDHVERVALERRRRDAKQPGFICLLLLERLGHEHLPLGKPIHDVITNDLFGIYEDLAALKILHEDIRYANILSVGPSTAAAVCPWHGIAHKYRVYDFEASQLVAAQETYFTPDYTGWGDLEYILLGLPKGNIIEISRF
ncbi:hypothetical protein PLICRDRAFT_169279 [Plicaturopsis crispa FD-325 SS-3]|nr:hypothetical protein PLICRDRAFT_169279 [Plicaturopsis crispa FD-325 SS-3]